MDAVVCKLIKILNVVVIFATDDAGFCNEQSISDILCSWGLQSKRTQIRHRERTGIIQGQGAVIRPEDRNVLLVDPGNLKVTKTSSKEKWGLRRN